jgi:Tc5 transposase DNA-binding domain
MFIEKVNKVKKIEKMERMEYFEAEFIDEELEETDAQILTQQNSLDNFSNSKKYSENDLISALSELNDGSTVYAASRKYNIPRTKDEVLDAAGQLANLNADGKRFKTPDGRPSSQWLNGFMKRHPDFSNRTPQSVSAASSKVSEEDIRRFLKNRFLHNIVDNIARK